MSSYILFSQTTTVTGDRANWGDGGGAASAQGSSAPGNPDSVSKFNADTLGPLGPGAALFDISSGANAALSALGTTTNVFAGDNKTKLSTNNVTSTSIELAQTGANWNGIKNLEIKLDSQSDVTNVNIKNFVDVRLQLGDDPCAPLLANAENDPINVLFTNVKRGEVDGSLANARLNVEFEVWSNGFGTGHFQNSFDNKGSVYDDSFVIGAGKVTNSMFGNKSGKTGYDADGTYDGRGTFVYTNLGGGNDSYDSTNSAGDSLSGGKEFLAIDKVWGGSADDNIKTGGGDDILFGDNGSGSQLYADPALATELADDNYITTSLVDLNGDDPGTGNVPGNFNGGAGPTVLAAADTEFTTDDMCYTITATGGELIQVKTGGGPTFAGGLGIKSADDPDSTGSGDNASLAESEIDSRGEDEAITFTFKTGAHSVEIDLSAFWSNEGAGGSTAEVAQFVAFDADGNPIAAGSVTADQSTHPASFTFSIDESDTGGVLIKSVVLTPSTEDGELSDFYVAALRACCVIAGQDGNDILDAGNGSDFLQGDGDTGAAAFCGAKDLDVIVNGGFEDFGDGSGGVVDHGSFVTFTSIPGWFTTTPALIEIQIGAGTGGVAPHGGENKLELDSHPDLDPATNATVTQVVDACEGVEYTLEFFFSSRPSDGGTGSSAFEVLWNGVTVFTFDDDPEEVGFQSSGGIAVVGAAGDNVLEFRGLGLENTLGAYIDDVSLVQNEDFIDIDESGGDQLALGLADNAVDTVNYEATDGVDPGDGFDVVRQFQKAGEAANSDVVTFALNGGTAAVLEVATSEGASTFITTAEDPTHGVLIVGQTGLVVGTDIIFS